MFTRALPWLLIPLFVIALPALAYAQAASSAPPDLGVLFGAMADGRWGWLTGLALIALVEPAKRALLARWPLSSDLAGLGLAFLAAAVTGLGAALVSGVPWSMEVVVVILRNAVAAIGGYTAIKRVLFKSLPGAGKILASMPAPLPKAQALRDPSITGTSGGVA